MSHYKAPRYEINIEKESRFEMELLVLPILREFVKTIKIYIIARKETRNYWFNSIFCYITKKVCIIDSIKYNNKMYLDNTSSVILDNYYENYDVIITESEIIKNLKVELPWNRLYVIEVCENVRNEEYKRNSSSQECCYPLKNNIKIDITKNIFTIVYI